MLKPVGYHSWVDDHTPGLHPMLTGSDGTSGLSALIELDEGPWISAALVDIDLNASPLHAGDAMAVRFLKLGDDSETIPVFSRA